MALYGMCLTWVEKPSKTTECSISIFGNLDEQYTLLHYFIASTLPYACAKINPEKPGLPAMK